MNKTFAGVISLSLICFSCQNSSVSEKPSDGTTKISLDLGNIQHHELIISISINNINSDTLFLRMPQSSPGRYAIHQFAKNVYSEKATDEAGNSLPFVKTDVSEWAVWGHPGNVVFTYTLFGNYGDGTYVGIDNKKLHMNMPGTFMYPVGLDKRPIELTVDLSDHPDWTVATQLEKVNDNTFTSPDYYYFYDSPTVVGKIDYRSWKVNSENNEYTIRIAMMHEGTDEELDSYTEWVKKVVSEEEQVYGSFPKYDFGEYTFLAMYNPWVYGDGMEHRNSTMCVSQGNLAENANRLIGTIAHEYFHCWNVERIRPKTLEPFNFDKPNMSGELWFAEGFTNYYGPLLLTRAGIMDTASYIRRLAFPLNAVIYGPGRKYRGPVGMSQNAPFVDAATAVDETNFSNTFISYYTYGSAVATVLDQIIRTKFPGKTLDDVMKYMWENYGKPEVPYTNANIKNALASVTGDQQFSDEFFDKYIFGHDFPDVTSLFNDLGIEVQLANPDKAGFPRLRLNYSNQGATIASALLETNPLYDAGLNQGDLIETIDGKEIRSADDFNIDWVVGQEYTVTYLQRGEEKTGSFTPKQDPTIKLVYVEDDGRQPTSEQLAKRKAWLGSKVQN